MLAFVQRPANAAAGPSPASGVDRAPVTPVLSGVLSRTGLE
jgi:hypothetical protein